MAQIDNLAIDVRENGVFLTFSASGGITASVDIEQLASRHEGEVRDVLLAWCQDRRNLTAPERTSRLLVQDYAD